MKKFILIVALCFIGALAHAQNECPPATSYSIQNSTGNDGITHQITCLNYVDGKLGHPWSVSLPPAGQVQLNVQSYGATGNGTTDDTAAINAAISACPVIATGCTLYFPQPSNGIAQYKITSTITITRSISLVGDHKAASIIRAVGFALNTPMFNYACTIPLPCQHVRIENLRLLSDNNLADGVYWTNVQKSKMESVYLFNLATAVTLDHSWDTRFSDVSIYATTIAGSIGFNLSGDQNNAIVLSGCDVAAENGLELIGSGTGLTIISSDFEGATVGNYGVSIAPATGKLYRDVRIIGTDFENIAGRAMFLGSADVSGLNSVIISGNNITGTGDIGIQTSNLTGFSIDHNFFLGWTAEAIFRGSESRGRVVNNTLDAGVPALSNSAGNLFAATVDVANNTLGRIVQLASAMPASGSFTQGDIVLNRVPAIGANKQTVIGWSRITTGAANVLGTDWQAITVYTDFSAPPAIGGTTPNTGSFSTMTIGSGTTILKHLSATAALNFASVTAPNCAADLTITVTGAAVGDTVNIGIPNAAQVAGGIFYGWVSAANTVSVRYCLLVGTQDPASATFRADVWQH